MKLNRINFFHVIFFLFVHFISDRLTMEVSQKSSDAKHHRENDKSSDESEQFPKIVDINDFCLINIFERLDLQSLLNIADANARLRPAAIDVYKRKFGTKLVKLNWCDIEPHMKPLRQLDSIIRILDFKTCLRYLRCFGPIIDELSIHYVDSESKRHDHVHQYLNDYCIETLARISFENMDNIAIDQFQKVFTNIKSVTFMSCELGENWPLFAKSFPNLRRLSLKSYDEQGCSMVYRFIEKPFPNLKHLLVEDLDCDGSTPIKFVADLLDGAHQLKSLTINDFENGISFVELLDLIKDKPSIIKLTADWAYGRVTSAEIQQLVSEHPALIELNVEETTFTTGDVLTLTRQLGSLKQFKFHTQVNYCSTERVDFAAQLSR